jgi:small multidrug resistance pump
MGYLFLGLALLSEVIATSFRTFTSGERAVWWACIVVVAGYGLSFWAEHA